MAESAALGSNLIPPHCSPLRGGTRPFSASVFGIERLAKAFGVQSEATFPRTQAALQEPDCNGKAGVLLETLLCFFRTALPQQAGHRLGCHHHTAWLAGLSSMGEGPGSSWEGLHSLVCHQEGFCVLLCAAHHPQPLPDEHLE